RGGVRADPLHPPAGGSHLLLRHPRGRREAGHVHPPRPRDGAAAGCQRGAHLRDLLEVRPGRPSPGRGGCSPPEALLPPTPSAPPHPPTPSPYRAPPP